jgi:hypothetical protein
MGQISFTVPMVEQGDNPICWIACVAMITSFKKQTSVGIGAFTGGFDPSNSCIPDPNDSWADFEARMNRFGFTMAGANQSLTAGFIEQMLRRHGPIMIVVNAGDFPFSGPVCENMGGTHALVLSGIDTGRGKVRVVNPWGTNVPPVDLDMAVRLLQDIADTESNPVAFMR